MARANAHWRAIEPGTPALAVVTGPEAYVSPAWYAAKAEHGRVVPTWNYSAVQFPAGSGARRRRVAARGRHPAHRPARAAARAAVGGDGRPAPYVEKQLRAIVGVELASSPSRARPS